MKNIRRKTWIAMAAFCAIFWGGLGATAANATTGFLEIEQQQGMHKICYYNVLGERLPIIIGAVELCPITAEFN